MKMVTNTQEVEKQPEEIEIVELDDRLDMAFDPIAGFLVGVAVVETNCGNIACGGCKP